VVLQHTSGGRELLTKNQNLSGTFKPVLYQSMFWSSLNRLTIPLLLLASAIVFKERIFNLNSAYSQLLILLPYITLGSAIAVSVFYNRARPFAVALGLVLTYWIIATQLQTSLSHPRSFVSYSVLSLSLPLTLIFLLLVPERGLRTWSGLWIIAIIPIQVMIAVWFRDEQAVFAFISDNMPILSRGRYNLSLLASACYIFCAVLATFSLFKQNSEHAASVLISAVFAFLVFAFYGVPKISLAMFSAAGLSLVSSLLRSSHDMAYRDELTGVRGRRALNERLKSLGRRFVIAMVDVDHFKKFNDTYGHEVGDDVLKMVSKQLATVKGGVAYRYGGEEFCIVFPGKDLEQCKPGLEAVREKIADYRLYVRDTQNRPRSQKAGAQHRGSGKKSGFASVTISIGAAESSIENRQVKDILQSADAALYEAKKSGRNRLVC
jgi:diguanylate cyclase (GGDEF)-like protein